MSEHAPPVRPVDLNDVEVAQKRISGTVLRTPLVKLDLGPDYPDIRLKLECLQPTNSYKIRGAVNAIANLSDEARATGVWTISAGNAGQGVAYAARTAGVSCTVVVIETAPKTKLDRIRALGSELIPVTYERAWQALEDRAYPGVVGTFIHPFDDQDFVTGHGTMGLEILEDAPDTGLIIAPIGGGGLITGVGSTAKALKPDIQVWGVEPETAAPFALSYEKGAPQKFDAWEASFVDGAGGQSVFPRMWERVRPIADRAVTVSLEDTRRAMRVIAEKARAVPEGAAALSLAAAMTKDVGDGPIVAIVSGGNVDLDAFAELVKI